LFSPIKGAARPPLGKRSGAADINFVSISTHKQAEKAGWQCNGIARKWRTCVGPLQRQVVATIAGAPDNTLSCHYFFVRRVAAVHTGFGQPRGDYGKPATSSKIIGRLPGQY
jgi:hypothetical protein